MFPRSVGLRRIGPIPFAKEDPICFRLVVWLARFLLRPDAIGLESDPAVWTMLRCHRLDPLADDYDNYSVADDGWYCHLHGWKHFLAVNFAPNYCRWINVVNFDHKDFNWQLTLTFVSAVYCHQFQNATTGSLMTMWPDYWCCSNHANQRHH